jgi:hypothetical protein
MALSTLRALRSEARAIPVPALALAAGDPSGNAILALDLGQKTGWAVRNTDGAIASGTVEFKPGRFEGRDMIYLASGPGSRRSTRPPAASAPSTSRRSGFIAVSQLRTFMAASSPT